MNKRHAPLVRSLEHGEERRLQIIGAAAQAFMRGGFSGTTIDDVARLMGCTKGMIYYHFKNKSELFFAVHRQTITMDLNEARAIIHNGANARARLRAMAYSRINAIIDNLPFQRVTLLGLEMRILGSTTPDDREMLDDLVKMYDEYENMFVEVISDGIEEGEFAPGDPRLLTKPLLGAINWMIMWYRPRPDASKAELQHLCDIMVEFVLRAISIVGLNNK